MAPRAPFSFLVTHSGRPVTVAPAGAATTRPPTGFRLLWLAEAVNTLGSQVTVVALPLVAVRLLHAGTGEVGVLNAAGTLAYLLVGLPAGPVVDRFRRRRVLVAADLAAAGCVGSVAVAHHAGLLSFGLLLAAALALGAAAVVAGVAAASLLPEVVPPAGLVTATGRLALVRTLGQVAGPAGAGVLIASFGPADAVLLDAASFVVAAAAVAAVRSSPVAAVPRIMPAREPVRRLIGEGLRYVAGTPLLRRITLAAAAAAGCGAVWQAALVVFCVRTLHTSTTLLGLLLAGSAAGGVLGSVSAGWLVRRLGRPGCIRWALPAAFGWGLLMPLARPGAAAWLVAIADFGMMFGSVVFNVAQTSSRPEACPRELLGRMNATIRTAVWGAGTVGSLAGAALGTLLAPRWVVLAGIAATAVVTLAISGRPLRDD